MRRKVLGFYTGKIQTHRNVTMGQKVIVSYDGFRSQFMPTMCLRCIKRLVKSTTGVESKLKDLFVRFDKGDINSIAKILIYEKHIVSRVSLEFRIYCFPISFPYNLLAVAIRYLKRWAGLPKYANPSIF